MRLSKKISDPDFEPIEDDFNNDEEDLGFEKNETYMNHYSDFEDDQNANNAIEEENAKMPMIPPMMLQSQMSIIALQRRLTLAFITL